MSTKSFSGRKPITSDALHGRREIEGAAPMSVLGKLRAESLAINCPSDPWLAPLHRVHGKVEFDGFERVSSQSLLDMLEVPQRNRTAGTFRRLAKLIAELGWTAVCVRDLTRGGYKEQVRGYVPGLTSPHAARHEACTLRNMRGR
jgi:hypothetical protein